MSLPIPLRLASTSLEEVEPPEIPTPAGEVRPLPPPGPRGRFLLGNALAFGRDSLGTLLDGWRQYGDVVRFRLLGPLEVYLVAHPDAIKQVLQERHPAYRKHPQTSAALRTIAGDGLVTSEGDGWLRQRRLMQPAFHRQHLARLSGLMTDAATRLLDERWAPRVAAAGQTPLVLDVHAEMLTLTLDVAARALFGTDVLAESGVIHRAVATVLAYMDRQIRAPLPLPAWLLRSVQPDLRPALADLDPIVFGIIAERRANRGSQGDLLSLLLAARDEATGAGMSDRQLRDEVLSLLIAGHETTAAGLTWTLALLAQHPAVARRLAVEVDGVLGGRTPTLEDLPRLPYVLMVIQEALRLYPPAWAMARVPIEDVILGGYRIPAGAPVILGTYLAHRHPAFWDQPEEFDPQRFAPEQVAQRPRFAYFPFGGGPRQCIGQSFALMEMHLVLATIARRYRLELAAGQVSAPEVVFTLRPRGGLPLVVTPRP